MTSRNVSVNSCLFEFKPSTKNKSYSQALNISRIISDSFYFGQSQCAVEVDYGWEENQRVVKIWMISQPELLEEFQVTLCLFKGKQEIYFPKKLIRESSSRKCILSLPCDDLKQKLPQAGGLNFGYRFTLQRGSSSHHEQMSSDDIPKQISQRLNETDSLRKLSEDFARLRESDSKTDVQLVCGETVFMGHKTVYTARSEWFRKNCQFATKNAVEVPLKDPVVFSIIEKYIYTAQIPDLSFELAKKIYAAGELCEVGCLKQMCVDYLIDNLTIETALECLAIANDDSFEEKIVSYIIENNVPDHDEYWKPFCDKHPKAANLVLNKLLRERRG